MSSDNSGRVQKSLLELSRLLLRRDVVPDGLIESLKRHLRPADVDVAAGYHYNALKYRLRNLLLAQSINVHRTDDGPHLVAKLEKELERLRRGNFKQLTAFLALIEPLSFGNKRTSNFLISKQTTSNMLNEEDDQWANTGRVDLNGGNDGSKSSRNNDKANFKSDSSESLTWVPPDVELKLIKDLLFVFQVCCRV